MTVILHSPILSRMPCLPHSGWSEARRILDLSDEAVPLDSECVRRQTTGVWRNSISKQHTCACIISDWSSTSFFPNSSCRPYTHTHSHTHTCIYIEYGANDKSNFQRTNKFNSPEEVFFPKKNWLALMGFEPCSLYQVLCQLSYQGSSVDDMGRISYTNTRQIIST